MNDRRLAIVFVAPAILFLAAMQLWPLAMAVDLSLRDVRYIGKPAPSSARQHTPGPFSTTRSGRLSPAAAYGCLRTPSSRPLWPWQPL